jgi:hypothetical protein
VKLRIIIYSSYIKIPKINDELDSLFNYIVFQLANNIFSLKVKMLLPLHKDKLTIFNNKKYNRRLL